MGFYYKYIPKLSLLGQLQTDMGSVLTYVSLLFNKQFKKVWQISLLSTALQANSPRWLVQAVSLCRLSTCSGYLRWSFVIHRALKTELKLTNRIIRFDITYLTDWAVLAYIFFIMCGVFISCIWREEFPSTLGTSMGLNPHFRWAWYRNTHWINIFGPNLLSYIFGDEDGIFW